MARNENIWWSVGNLVIDFINKDIRIVNKSNNNATIFLEPDEAIELSNDLLDAIKQFNKEKQQKESLEAMDELTQLSQEMGGY